MPLLTEGRVMSRLIVVLFVASIKERRVDGNQSQSDLSQSMRLQVICTRSREEGCG
jgi:hypothetical protein